MTAITIFMEGGGLGLATKDTLRCGMDAFLGDLREAARARSWQWRLVCCGDRGRAFKAFEAAVRQGESGLLILLVDSEAPVTAATFGQHLQQHDGRDFAFASDDQIHLMVQTMETWIVADRPVLKSYYDEGWTRANCPDWTIWRRHPRSIKPWSEQPEGRSEGNTAK